MTLNSKGALAGKRNRCFVFSGTHLKKGMNKDCKGIALHPLLV